MSFFWNVIVGFKEWRGQPLRESQLTEYRGYRRAIGGFWGQWEVKLIGSPFKMWIPSDCQHYPRPPLTTHTEPLETEAYV